MIRLYSRACALLALLCLVSTHALAATTPAKKTPGRAASRATTGRNLLENPGFETGRSGHSWMPASWDTSNAALPTIFFGRDTFLVHGGSYAVNVANLSTLFPYWHNWSQAVPVGPEAWGKDAVFSVWTRSNGLQGRAYVLVQAYRDSVGRMAKVWGMERDEAAHKLRINKVDDPLIDLGWKREYFTDPETDWVRREVRVFVPPTVNILYVRGGILGTGQVIFDDASLTLEPARPAPPVPLQTNLLGDPGFEGDGNAWEYAMPPYEGMKVERDTTVAHSGRASITSYGGTTGMVSTRTGVCQVFSNHNLAGKRLKLTGWVRTDSLRATAFVKIYCHTLHGMVQSDPPMLWSSNTPWTETSIEMDVPDDTYNVWVWFLYNAPAEGRVWFDDCSLVALGPATKKISTPKPPAGKAER